MQEEARCEKQSNNKWRVWLHPSRREVAVYSDESQALDVTALINLKIKLDANLHIEGLTDDLDAEQIELVTNMPMEELLQKVMPEQVESETTESTDNEFQHSDDQQDKDKETEKEGDSELDEDGKNASVNVTGSGPPLSKLNFWQRNSDGSYSKVLPTTLKQIGMPTKVQTEVFGSINKVNELVFITKSSQPKLDNRRFECQFSVPPKGYFHINKGWTNLLGFLKAKKGHNITLYKGPAAGQAFISTQVQRVECHEAPVIIKGIGRTLNPWTKNSDGSYSKQLPPSFGKSGTYLTAGPEIGKELIRHENNDFILITKSADPDVDGKRFPVGFGLYQAKPSQTHVNRGFCDVARCLNLQPYDVVTLSKGLNIGEVYISVTKDEVKLPCGDLLAADADSGGVQKRQQPSPSSDLEQDSPPAKRHKSSIEPSSTPGLGHHQLQESDTIPETIQVVQGAAERRSLPEMLALVKSIIEKEAVGLSAAERISYRTKFMIKMTPEVQVSSLQMLEELDGAGEHDGVKLCVQMSLQDLN